MYGAAGSLLAGLAVRNLVRGSASKYWPQTEGCILRSFVLVQKDSDHGESYMPQVEYEYVVEGKKYHGTRLRYGQIGTWTRKQAERVLAPFPEGGRAAVFYNPRRPKDAVLLCGTSWGNIAIVLGGSVFLGVVYLFATRGR